MAVVRSEIDDMLRKRTQKEKWLNIWGGTTNWGVRERERNPTANRFRQKEPPKSNNRRISTFFSSGESRTCEMNE